MQQSKSILFHRAVSAAFIAITLVTGFSAAALESPLQLFRAPTNEVTLKDKFWTVTFDKNSGALLRLESHSTGWNMESRPKLGVSFRLNVPQDHHDNFIYGRNQKAVEVKKLSDHQVRLQWKDLVSQDAGTLPITLT